MVVSKLEMARMGRKITIKDLSMKLNIYYSDCFQYLKGDRRVPQKWQAAIARELGMTIEEAFNSRGLAKEAE
jgi:hypothetical protein